jgi:hypothetical protein
MPGWLLWTLVGLGAWCTSSIGFALLVGRLLGRRRGGVPAGRVLILAPRVTRTRSRPRAATRLH